MPALARIAPAVLLGLWACGGSQSHRAAEPERSVAAARTGVQEFEAAASPTVPRRLRAVVALEGENTVAILGGPPWRRIRRIAVARGPHNVDASPDGDFVAVTSPPADRVTILDARGRIVARARARVVGAPHDTVFTANGRRLWVTAERASRLVQLAVPSGRVVRSVAMPGPPHDVTLARAGTELWVTIDGSSAVERRSARTGRSLGRALPGGAPHDLALEPGGRRVWLSNWSSGVLTIASTPTGRAVDRISAGIEPHHFAFTGRRAWASDNATGMLVRIGLRTRRVLGRTSVGSTPHHVAAAREGVLVAIHGSGRVAVVSARGRRTASLPVGRGPHGIAVVPAPFSGR